MADQFGVESRALMVRTLQQLPRVASFSGRVSVRQAAREIGFCARRLRRETLDAAGHVPTGQFSLSELRFAQTDAIHAGPLLTSLHYLRSVRPGSRYFALADPIQNLPVAVCSVSALQWPRLEKKMLERFAIPGQQILDVCRVFSIDSAPPNSISYLSLIHI